MKILSFQQWVINESADKEFDEFHKIMKMAEPKAPPAVSTYTDSFKTLQRFEKSEKEEILDILKSNIFIEPLNLIINPNSARKDINYVSEMPNDSYTKENQPGLYDIPVNTAKYFVRWFLHAGLSLEGACAMAGNLWKESYFNPKQRQIEGGPGRGLAQWTEGERWTTYSTIFYPSFRSANQLLTTYDMLDLEPQLSFVIYELKNSYRGIWNELKSPGDLHSKTMRVLKKYEAPATKNDPDEQNKRYKCANIIMNIAQSDNRLKYIANSVDIQKQQNPSHFA